MNRLGKSFDQLTKPGLSRGGLAHLQLASAKPEQDEVDEGRVLELVVKLLQRVRLADFFQAFVDLSFERVAGIAFQLHGIEKSTQCQALAGRFVVKLAFD